MTLLNESMSTKVTKIIRFLNEKKRGQVSDRLYIRRFLTSQKKKEDKPVSNCCVLSKGSDVIIIIIDFDRFEWIECVTEGTL